MIKKILLTFLIVIIWYGISIFLLPHVSSQIDALLWVPGFSESIRWKKEFMDFVTTDGAKEFIDKASNTASWAKSTIVEGIDVTKEKIDSVRESVQKAEETYNSIVENVDTIKSVYEDTTQKISNIQGTIERVTGTWSN